jgi:hypothetical protein
MSLINGYSSLGLVYVDAVSLMKATATLEQRLQRALSRMRESMHYLRMLAIVRLLLYNDPVGC